ncbi:MAG TPA: hypothetical protein VNQ77_13610 [Frankiaceae bacterium]|nr:hypothetical protein [Frankiaceae bacterium]
MSRGLAGALQGMSFDPLLSRVAAAHDWDALTSVADWLVTADPYGESDSLAAATRLLGLGEDDVGRHVEHRLWCAWRQAAWVHGREQRLPVKIEGAQWLDETSGHPTLVVAPMTLATSDALVVIATAMGDREVATYGEDMDPSEGLADADVNLVGAGSDAVRQIARVLDAGGALCTYADFVYAGHRVVPVTLFGTRRHVAAGFVAFAARPGAMLLPAVCLARGDHVVLRFEEPYAVEADEGVSRARLVPLLAPVVAGLLEDMIRLAGHQWLLLPTLTFESRDMG